MAKVGRPKLKIDPNDVEQLAALQCTYEEIAAFCGCDKSTISRNFATEINKGREAGKISLRRKQFKLADTSAAMAIFLGKNYLGQRDTFEYESGDNINATLAEFAGLLKSHTNPEPVPTGQSQIHGTTGGQAIKKDADK